MVSPSLFSSEIELATVIVFTGFACLRNNPEQKSLERSCRIARATTGQRRSVPSHSKWVWLRRSSRWTLGAGIKSV
jgi:hypothetical protein